MPIHIKKSDTRRLPGQPSDEPSLILQHWDGAAKKKGGIFEVRVADVVEHEEFVDKKYAGKVGWIEKMNTRFDNFLAQEKQAAEGGDVLPFVFVSLNAFRVNNCINKRILLSARWWW